MRERFGQATSATSGPQTFVAADSTQSENTSSLNSDINNDTSTQKLESQETTQANKAKEVDIFAE